jgi:nicotinate dehydrogenase subunit B
MTAKPRTWPTRPPGRQSGAGPAGEGLVSERVALSGPGAVTVRVGKVELGQGVGTALAQIAADFLGVALGRITMAEIRTGASPNEGFTAGSRSLMDAGTNLARAAATARRLFLDEAAARFGQPVGTLRTSDGAVLDPAGAVLADYWALHRPGMLDVPADEPVAWDVPTVEIGRSVPRFDFPGKFAGAQSYVHDMALPGMLHGRVVRPPEPGARLVELAELPPDLRPRVVREGSFLGLLADREWAAVRDADRLAGLCRWSPGRPLEGDPADGAALRSGDAEPTTVVARGTADHSACSAVLRNSYSRPYLAHASIGPSCAVAVFDPGRIEVWSHTQGVYPLRAAIASVCGVAEERVRVHHAQGAGCYGHNAADDVALDAVLLARAAPGRPVKVVLSRADEFLWEPYGPPMVADIEAGLDSAGAVRLWRHHVWGYGHQSRPGFAGHHGLLGGWLATDSEIPAAADPPLSGGGGTARNAAPIYDFPVQEVVAHRKLDMPIRTSSMRALGAMLNVFAIESMMDELALQAGADPIAFRLRHLTDERARSVLEALAAGTGWNRRRPVDGLGRGIGFARYKNNCAYCAAHAEVQAEDRVRVTRISLVVDAGLVVNPDGLVNQVEGGAVQAASWALLERVRFGPRGPASPDWESYPILRFSEVPEVAVTVIDQPGRPPLGVGECAQGPVAAAIANAVADAIGVRVRDLPLTPERVIAAMEG